MHLPFKKLIAGTSLPFSLVFLLMISSRTILLSERDTLIGLLKIPIMFPQMTVCSANVQNFVPCSIGTSVQVIVVWLVVVGQLPQFDARML